MRLHQLIAALPSLETKPQSDPDITLITADSRKVIPGALFVAYPGVSVDGHRFIPEAIQRGAVAIVGEYDLTAFDQNAHHVMRKTPYLKVRNGREAFAYLHAAWNDFPARQLIMIGVTGTDGKTTTTNLIHSILTAAGIKAGLISTVNALIGDRVLDTGLHTTTPDADDVQRYLAEMVKAGMTHCVLETTSHGLVQHRVDACEFDIAVVTNITHEHLDLHGSYEGYRAAKAILFESLATAYGKGVPKTAVLNQDDASFEYLYGRVKTRTLTYAIGDQATNLHADVLATDIEHLPGGMVFDVWQPNFQPFVVDTYLVGNFNVYNCAAAIAATVGALGIDVQAASGGLTTFKGVPGRMERVDEGQDFIAIVDFAHTPNALDHALTAAHTMTNGRVIVTFGCAGLRDREKRRRMGEVAGRSADKIVITAEDPRTESLAEIMAVTAQALEAEGRVESVDFWRVPDRGAAIAYACSLARPGDVVIACGKGHEQSMCFGTIEYPWDDRAAMRAAIKGTPLKTLPTAAE